MGRSRQVGVAHAEINDIGARIACRRLRAIDLLEDIGRQTPNAVELFHYRRSWRCTDLRGAAQRAPCIMGFWECEGSVEGFQRRRSAFRHYGLLFLRLCGL